MSCDSEMETATKDDSRNGMLPFAHFDSFIDESERENV
jgi:hypothetical protein